MHAQAYPLLTLKKKKADDRLPFLAMVASK